MNFSDQFNQIKTMDIGRLIASAGKEKVEKVLSREKLDAGDFAALLSPAALPYLEQMARKAHDITRNHFGSTLQLFTPMYLSNFCINHCLYCGFNHKVPMRRHRLTLDEVEREAAAIAATGLRHILVLTGDDPRQASVAYIAASCTVLKEYFSSIGIEVFALSLDEYRALIDSGVDGLTIYQETYNEDLYTRIHPKGPKKAFRFRLQAPERGALAGMRSVGIGALLGLDHWQRDFFITALHARWLERRFPETEFSISLPRIRPHSGRYSPACLVSDRDMVQMITALRLFLPRCGITVSTRENPSFRDNILKLGVTKVSAGTTTAVGGHTAAEASAGQFEISDNRSVDEMVHALQQQGLQPVFKDWQRCS